MTKQQSSLFRFLLFLAGAGIIILAFFLTRETRQYFPPETNTFIWISIAIMYLVFFYPFFFSLLNIADYSRKIPSRVIIWSGILTYVILSLGNILLLAIAVVITINAAIIIQSILFFFFLLSVYFGFFVGSYLKSVAVEEAEKLEYLTKVKLKSSVLLLSVNKLPSQYEKVQKILARSIDDIKYISPLNNRIGSELELNILGSIASLSQIINSILSGTDSPTLENEADNLRSLVNERKLLRN